MQKKLLLYTFIPILIGITIYGAFFVDKHLKMHQVKSILNSSAQKYNDKMNLIIEETKQLTKSLPKPAKCDDNTFEKLIYEHKYIKNIGILKNNSIICDAYSGNISEGNIEKYSILRDHKDMEIYKFWYKNGFFGLAMKNGYFFEIDSLMFTDFDINKNLGGIINIYQPEKKRWFQLYHHHLSKSAKNRINKVIHNELEAIIATGQIKKMPIQVGSIILRIEPIGKNSLAFIFTDMEYLEKFGPHNMITLLIGGLFGIILSLLFITIHKKSYSMKNMLIKDIKNNKLFMVYQPLVNLTNKDEIIGFESLVRWKMNNSEMIPPDVFIPIAEKNHLTKKLTLQIIDKVFDDLHIILQKNKELYVSINITPSDLHDDAMAQQLQSKLSHYNLLPQNIVIELTERIIADKSALVGINELKKLGFKISIDDFGTGASNIKYLGELEPDILKVDRTFIVWSDNEGPTSELLKQLIQIGNNFNIKVVTEGVETKTQAERCREHGADVGQGYFWHKPLPIEQVKEILETLIKT